MNTNFWKNKTVLITGHTGFKGSWLSLILKKFGANVIGFSKNIPTNPSMYEIANIENGMTNIFGDINDSKKIYQVLVEHKPDIVFHMAAQAIVRESYKDPLETFSTNILGTANILEAIRKIGNVKVAIMITSDKSYRVKNDHSKYSEDDPMGGYDPYSSSKGCAELVISAYRNSFFNIKNKNDSTAIASVRAGNVLGGGDWGADRLIPDIIRGIQKKETIQIRNPKSIRPWQFVLDPLAGYLSLAEKMWENRKQFSKGWNFGPTNSKEETVEWIIKFLKEQLNEEIDLEINNSIQPHEEKYLRLDCSKATNQLGWESKMNLGKTLLWTMNWYAEYLKNNNVEEFTKKQIDEYMRI